MRVLIFQTHEAQAQGLQHRPCIENDVLFVFPMVGPGDQFHSRNVKERFDLAFLSRDMVVLQRETVTPPLGTSLAPDGSFIAVEAKAGNLEVWGFEPGRRVSF